MSSNLTDAVRRFLDSSGIAVAGASRSPQNPGHAIFLRLRSAGLKVYPVNPAASEIAGVACYPDLTSIPGGVEAVLIAAPPAATEGILRECRRLGITKVWIHRSFGAGSSSPAAVRYCREEGISVIDGACPLMFCAPVDGFHRFLHGFLGFFRRLPRPQGDWR